MLTSISADIMEKLKILSDAAKFDVACTSSGASVRVMEMIWGVHLPVEYVIRLQLMAGVYRFLKILFTNWKCIYDCKYCIQQMH